MSEHHSNAIEKTQDWLVKAVIGLNLCPFAKGPHMKEQIRYVLSEARDLEQLIADLQTELEYLASADINDTETTLLIHPQVLNDFLNYNDFLEIADKLLIEMKLDGVLQVASFHPDYQFADTQADDITNFTNRSPYPTLHLIREESIDRAVEAFPEAETIFEANMNTMRRLGLAGWKKLFLKD